MKYNTFAKSDLQVSRLGFGAMGLGGSFGKHDEKYLIHSIHHCLDKGINFIDTARVYADSETIVGKALKSWTGEAPFIASKVKSQSSLGWGTSVPVEAAYPKGAIRLSVEESLKQLAVDSIDLMQMHQYWPQWDLTDYWMEDLLKLKDEGKIRYIGISIPDHRHDMAIYLVRTGQIDSVQTIVNIFDPLAFDNLIPICQENQVAVIARCILDEGGLTGFLQENTTFEKGDFRLRYFDTYPRAYYMERVDKLKAFIPTHADSLAQLAVKYATCHPGITTALSSMNIVEYADENIAALDQPSLSADVFEELNKHHRWVKNSYETYYW